MSRDLSNARIGLDLDNTLISYDRVFYEVAIEQNFIPAGFTGNKREIRDRIRLLPNGETEWQRLQARVYGPEIDRATATPGALDFMRMVRGRGAELAIVSHKTMYSNLGTETCNLHHAARGWLLASGMVGPDSVAESNVYFENTRIEKIDRIISIGCTHFIDDLEEVFDDPTFPQSVERFLLSSTATSPGVPYRAYPSFEEIARVLA